MGFVSKMFGGGSQQPQTPMILPPPPAPPAANPPSIADPSAVASGVKSGKAGAAAAAGFDGTLLTGGQGLGAPPTAGGLKKLTGE